MIQKCAMNNCNDKYKQAIQVVKHCFRLRVNCQKLFSWHQNRRESDTSDCASQTELSLAEQCTGAWTAASKGRDDAQFGSWDNLTRWEQRLIFNRHLKLRAPIHQLHHQLGSIFTVWLAAYSIQFGNSAAAMVGRCVCDKEKFTKIYIPPITAFSHQN